MMVWNPFRKKDKESEPAREAPAAPVGQATTPPSAEQPSAEPPAAKQPPPEAPAATDQPQAAAPAGDAPPRRSLAPGARTPAELHHDIVEVLKTVYDPEIPVDIYELGLVYDIDIDASGEVDIRMTLTSPMCPVAGSLPPEVETKVRTVPGVSDVRVELVWDPPWSPEKMSEATRLKLGLM